MFDLSIIIPSRQEMFLKNTVEDILKHLEGNTEIIIGLDGEWADPAIQDHPRVTVVHYSESIGQRAMTNRCVSLSKAKFVMKVDAHCSFDQGFDAKMMREMQDDWTMVPIMRNLWAFDWKCYSCGWKKYQGPTPEKCEKCGGTNIRRKMMWIGKHNPQSTSFCFDAEPHFQYFEAWKHREPYISDKREKGLTETMSLQGSCFMSTREKYLELNLCDEDFGSWGNQAIEVACKTWLSGGKVMVNHKTWYAHLFRTQGKDFSFPYHQSGREVQNTKNKVKDLFWNNKYEKAIYPLSWLIEKFMPVPGWTIDNLNKLKEYEFNHKNNCI